MLARLPREELALNHCPETTEVSIDSDTRTGAMFTVSRRTRGAMYVAISASLMAALSSGCEGNIQRMSAGAPQDAYIDPSNPDKIIVPDKDGNPVVVDRDPVVDPTDPTDPTPVDFERTAPYVRRLTQLQYHNTIREGLGDVFEEEEYPELDDAIPTIGFSNNPNFLGLNDTNAGKLYDSVQKIAQKSVTDVPAVRDCVAASDDACFTTLIRDLGEKLWRRPLSDEEVGDLDDARAQIAAAPGTREEQAEFVVQALLMNVNTLYRTEIGEEGFAALSDGDRVSLSSYELASALSYTLWNTPPDAELLQLAAADELKKPEVYEAQLERMLEDARVASAMTEFFVDFLKIDKLYIKEKEATFGLTDNVRRALVEGVREDLRATLDLPDATLYDPFRETSFHINQQSAPYFQVDGMQTGSSFERVSLDPNQRYGVLTHPAFLSVHSGTKDSGIVKRGVFTLEQLLCQHLGAPPADISPAPPESLPEGFDPARVSTREALHVQHSSQIQCYTCHKQIDPAGFGYENYDGAGRWRLTEKGDITIDASGSLLIDRSYHDEDNKDEELLEFTTSIDYVQAITNSDTMKRCFTERLMTYVLGETPSHEEHTSFLEQFDAHQGSLDPVLKALLLSPSFTTRQIVTKEQ